MDLLENSDELLAAGPGSSTPDLAQPLVGAQADPQAQGSTPKGPRASNPVPQASSTPNPTASSTTDPTASSTTDPPTDPPTRPNPIPPVHHVDPDPIQMRYDDGVLEEVARFVGRCFGSPDDVEELALIYEDLVPKARPDQFKGRKRQSFCSVRFFIESFFQKSNICPIELCTTRQ